MKYITIDPGVKYFGWAFGTEVLKACGYVYFGNKEAACDWLHYLIDKYTSNQPYQIVIELPIVRRNANINPVDIENLKGTVEALRKVAPEYTALVKPADWKGTIPKEKHQPRILGALSPVEYEIVLESRTGDPNKDKDIIDAVGLLLWIEKRLKR